MAKRLEAKNLETIAEETPSLEELREQGIYICNQPEIDNYKFKHPALDYFTDKIKDKKRREEIKAEVERVFSRYMEYLKKYAPTPRRAAILEQSYHSIPDEEEIKGKDPKEVLRQRLYSNPGRQYLYLNGIVGNKKKRKGIKYELGRAAGYTLKEGWPVLGAGTGWWLINKKYKGVIAKGLEGRLREAFGERWWKYLIPGLGPASALKDFGKFLSKEGLISLWGLAGTPLMYAIGAYAAYKTIKYFIKRRREKRLEHEETERLERIRNDMALQNQMMYQPG